MEIHLIADNLLVTLAMKKQKIYALFLEATTTILAILSDMMNQVPVKILIIFHARMDGCFAIKISCKLKELHSC